MSEAGAKYIVVVVCSDRMTYQINILHPRIELSAFHLLYGRMPARLPDEVRASGDLYLYPELIPAEFTDGEPCRSKMVLRVCNYVRKTTIEPLLLSPRRFDDYRRHWDFFGLSPESFQLLHRNIAGSTYVRAASAVAPHVREAAAVVPGAGLVAPDGPIQFSFKVSGFPLTREDKISETTKFLVCEVVGDEAGIYLVDDCEQGICLFGQKRKPMQLHADFDVLQFGLRSYPIQKSAFRPAAYLDYAFETDSAIDAAARPFYRAVSLFLPFSFPESRDLVRLLCHTLPRTDRPFIVAAQSTDLVLQPIIVIYNSAENCYFSTGEATVRGLMEAFEKEGRDALFAAAKKFLASKEANGKRKTPIAAADEVE